MPKLDLPTFAARVAATQGGRAFKAGFGLKGDPAKVERRSNRIRAMLDDTGGLIQALSDRYRRENTDTPKISRKIIGLFQDYRDAVDKINADASLDDQMKADDLAWLEKNITKLKEKAEKFKRDNDDFISDFKTSKQKGRARFLPDDEIIDITLSNVVSIVSTAWQYDFPLKKLAAAEAMAIHLYTGAEYVPINKWLRDGTVPANKTQEQIAGMADLVTAGIKKLPKKPIVSNRGEGNFPGSADIYTQGNEFTIRTIWSSGVGWSFDYEWQHIIHGLSGRDIQGISAKPYENEVVFLPGTRFKVVQVVAGNNNVTRTVLRELGK